jgi:hypothetical protein
LLSGGDLSIPLASSVPPQHLMRPVHSTGRRHACLFHWQAARPCCRMRYTHHHSYVPRKLLLCVNTTRAADIWAPEDLSGVTCISCSMYFFIMSLGPHVGAQQPCMCLPWAIKGKAHDVTRHAHLDATQTVKLIDSHTQYNPQWSRVLRFGGPNHSKSSYHPVCSSTI